MSPSVISDTAPLDVAPPLASTSSLPSPLALPPNFQDIESDSSSFSDDDQDLDAILSAGTRVSRLWARLASAESSLRPNGQPAEAAFTQEQVDEMVRLLLLY